MKRIAITALKGSGKSVTANYLMSKYGSEIRPLASVLKKMLIAMGVPEEYIYGDKKEEIIPFLGVTGRFLMQSLGTDWGRNIVGRSIWVNMFLFNLKEDDNVIVDDVRFPNEADALRKAGFTLIRINRPSLEHQDTHESERYVNVLCVDADVCNDSSLENLYQEVDLALNKRSAV